MIKILPGDKWVLSIPTQNLSSSIYWEFASDKNDVGFQVDFFASDQEEKESAIYFNNCHLQASEEIEEKHSNNRVVFPHMRYPYLKQCCLGCFNFGETPENFFHIQIPTCLESLDNHLIFGQKHGHS